VIKTLRLRLTLWHAGLFGMLALIVFMMAYYIISHQLLRAVDVDLKDTAQEFAERLTVGGIPALQLEIDSETASHGTDIFFARFVDQHGNIQAEHLSPTWLFPIPRPMRTHQQLQWFHVGEDMDGGPVRLLALPVTGLGWIEIGLSLSEYATQMHQIRTVFALALLVMVALGVLAGWLQLRTVFRSVEQVRRTAIDISEGELSRRVELAEKGSELSDLANAFNKMLDRIQLLLGEMRDVSNHIAHDLRTPVSCIRGLAETSLTAAYQSAEHQTKAQTEALATIVEEADQLGEMVNTMLEIAQTDAGLINQQQEQIDLVILLHDACELFQPVAEDAGMKLTIDAPDHALMVTGNKARLQRAIANLIDNALKFSHAEDHIELIAETDQNSMCIHIRDHGIGISADDRSHIFERFYRSDQSRTKPGNGLGLSYAMSIIRSHGGTIDVTSTPGHGSTFTVRLPLG